jgi:hypothetical protein
MFSLNILDLVRLDSEQVAQNYTVHAGSAERTVRLIFNWRIAITALLAVATGTAIMNLLSAGRAYAIATVTASAVALLAFAAYEMLGLEARLFAHRALAHRLWLVSERYRSLLSEVNEGIVDRETLVQRRDELIGELHLIYEFGFGVDQTGHEVERLPTITNEEAA